jgi:hypothetical protein
MSSNDATFILPIADLRSWRFLSLTPDRHPLVRAARTLLGGRRVEAVKDLRAWYAENTAQTVAEWFGFTPINMALRDLPPWAVPHPWWDEDAEARRRKAYANIAAEYGIEASSDTMVGVYWNVSGPVADTVPDFEIGRLERIIHQRDVRHERGDSLPRVRCLLTRGLPTLWEIKSGHHRISVEAALGLRFVRTQVRAVVYEDVSLWPGVRSGLFTRDDALTVFEKVGAG